MKILGKLENVAFKVHWRSPSSSEAHVSDLIVAEGAGLHGASLGFTRALPGCLTG